MRNQQILLYLLAVTFVLSGCTTLKEKADFYGIKMRSESVAKEFTQTPSDGGKTQYAYNPGRMDKQIYAYAYLERTDFFKKSITSLRVRVINDSKDPINVDPTFSAFTLVLKNKTRLDMKSWFAIYPGTDVLKAGSEQTFAFSVGRWKVNKEDIHSIVCSFNLGEDQVILLPTLEDSGHPSNSTS